MADAESTKLSGSQIPTPALPSECARGKAVVEAGVFFSISATTSDGCHEMGETVETGNWQRQQVCEELIAWFT